MNVPADAAGSEEVQELLRASTEVKPVEPTPETLGPGSEEPGPFL